MSDSDEAHRLKTLAEQEFSSGNLISALKHAKLARTIDPDLPGLPELVTAFRIIRASKKMPTPDYYKVLQLEPFSHINAIKKQYKQLALTLHPDKNSFTGCEDAFKAVNEAMRVFSDKIRRQEYDMRLRISLQETETGGDEVVETFWTACGECRLLHKFEKKYLGHSLVCPGCKNNFKAVEVDDDRDSDSGGSDNDGKESSYRKNEEDMNVQDGGEVRASARIRDKVAKGWSLGTTVERLRSVGVKRKVRSVEEVLESSVSEDNLSLNDLRLRMVAEKNEKGKRAMENEEEKMTLSEMQMLVRKKKKSKKEEVSEVRELSVKENEDSMEKLKRMEREREEREVKEKAREVLNKSDEEKTDGEKEMANTKIKTYTRRAKSNKSSDFAETRSEQIVNLDPESDRLLDIDNMDEIVLQNGNKKEKGKEQRMEGTGEKRERRRVSRYRSDTMNVEERITEHDSRQEIEKLINAKKGNNFDIMHVEDSDFHDFDEDRKPKSFKNGQVWAVYDNVDGMPRLYALIHKVSSKPFEVILSWLSFEPNTDEDSLTWHKMGYQISCGRFKVCEKVSIDIHKLFSHVVSCDRAAREAYRIYPNKGSVWALYKREAATQSDETDKDKRSFDIVIALSSYSDVYGLSVAHLVKADGFKTVFKRREIGPKAVLWLGKKDMKLFSHQIPAKKLSGDEALNLPEHCWELDPASLVPELINES